MLEKELQRKRRHCGIRKKIVGTPARPRLCVHRSARHFYVQVINDMEAKTLLAFSTLDKEFAKSLANVKKVEKSEKLGQVFAGRLKEKGIQKIAFDRAGYRYHGRIQAFAEALRKGGIEF